MRNNRIIQHIQEHNLNSQYQHGFRKRRGVDRPLTILIENIALEKWSKHSIDVVMRDIKKTFDKVRIVGLQYKIINLNLASLKERIVYDYVMDRRATITIEDYSGPLFELKAGVP